MIVPFKLLNSKFIYIDLNTRERVFNTLEFDIIFPFENGFSIVFNNGKYGVVNLKGKICIPIIYSHISNFSENYFLVSCEKIISKDKNLVTKNVKSGIIDTENKLIIPPVYDNLSAVCNGLVKFSNESDEYSEFFTNPNIKYGYLNLNNEVQIEPIYLGAKDFSEGYAAVGNYFGLDEDYNEIIRYGYINVAGKVVIDFIYDFADSFKNGQALVEQNNNSYHINYQGIKTIQNPKNDVTNDKLLLKFTKKQEVLTIYGELAIIEKFGYKNNFGKIIIDPIYSFAEDFVNGLARVSIDNNTFYILTTGEELCERYENF